MATWLLSDFLEAWGQRMSIYHTRNNLECLSQGSPRMDGDSLGLGGNYTVGNNLECSIRVVLGYDGDTLGLGGESYWSYFDI